MKKFVWIASILTLLSYQAYAATTYYADPSGSGTTCSEGSPCTLSYTIGTKAQNGDTVIVNPGTYSSVNQTVSKDNLTITTTAATISTLGTFTDGIPSGSEVRPWIQGRFMLSGDGNTIRYMRVRIQSSRSDSYTYGFTVTGQNNTIEYTEIYNGGQAVGIHELIGTTLNQVYIHACGARGTSSDQHGVEIARQSGHSNPSSFAEGVLIKDCTFTDTGGDGIQDNSACANDYGGSRIGQISNYVTVDSCVFYDFDEGAIDMKSTSYLIVSNSEFYGNPTEDDSAPIQATAPTDDCAEARTSSNFSYWYIYNNIIHDCNTFALIPAGYAESYADHWIVYNNLFYEVSGTKDDVETWNFGTITLPGDSGSVAYENTLYNCATGANKDSGINGNGGGTARNNIFYNVGAGGRSGIYSIGTASNNYYYNSGTPTGSINVTICYAAGNCPGFTDINGDDYSLQSDSPCVDVGYTLSSPYDEDILGVSRPQGDDYDIGANEYSEGEPSTTQISGASGSIITGP